MPALTLYTSQRNSVSKNPSRKFTSSSLSTRLLEADKRPKHNKLGPGSYILPETDHGPCFEFTLTERFKSNYSDKIESKFQADYLLIASHLKTDSKDTQMIIKNMDMTPHRPATRLINIEIKAINRASQIRRIQTQRSSLVQTKIQVKLEAIEAKNKRGLIRKNKQVRTTKAATQVVVAWTMLMSCVAVTKELKHRHHNRVVRCMQTRKQRAEGFLKTLMSTCLAVGRFKFVLYRIRIKKAIYVLSRLVPYIGRFLLSRRKHFSSILTHVVEQSLTQSLMCRFMLAWKQKVMANQLLLIQREWRKALKYRSALYIIMRAKWRIAETELSYLQRKVSRPRKTRSLDLENVVLKGSSTIPDEVKDFFIKQHIRKLTNDFYTALKHYRQEAPHIREKVQHEFYRRQAAALLKGEDFQEVPSMPPMPRLCLTVSKDTMKQLITLALDRRLEWNHIQSATTYLTQPRHNAV